MNRSFVPGDLVSTIQDDCEYLWKHVEPERNRDIDEVACVQPEAICVLIACVHADYGMRLLVMTPNMELGWTYADHFGLTHER